VCAASDGATGEQETLGHVSAWLDVKEMRYIA